MPFEDSSIGHSEVHTPTVEGATIDTDVYKYGGGSGHFNGNYGAQYFEFVHYPASPDWYFGTDPFTISCWVYKQNGVYFSDYVSQDYNNGQYYQLFEAYSTSPTNNSISFVKYDVNGYKIRILADVTWEIGWNHVEIGRDASSGYVFLNGVKQTLIYNTFIGDTVDFNVRLDVGRHSTSPSRGYMDVLKIDKGICRHTADFTPPADEDVENDQYTVLLLKMNPPYIYTLSLQEYMDFLLDFGWKGGLTLSDLYALADHYLWNYRRRSSDSIDLVDADGKYIHKVLFSDFDLFDYLIAKLPALLTIAEHIGIGSSINKHADRITRDYLELADSSRMSYSQRLSQYLNLHDMRFLIVSLVQTLTDSLSLSDVSIRKPLLKKIDTISFSDVINTKDIVKHISSPLSLSDIFYGLFGIIRNISDSLSLGDTFGRAWTAITSFGESEDLTDSKQSLYRKRELENQYFADINTKKVDKTFVEGALSLFDVRVFSILKEAFDASSLSDFNFFFAKKQVDEYLDIADVFVGVNNKFITFADVSVLADHIIKGIFQTKQEQLDFIEYHGLYYAKYSYSNLSLRDVFDTLKQYILSFTDQTALADIVAKLFSISFNETSSVSDMGLSKYIKPSFADVFDIADMFLLNMNNALHFYIFNKVDLGDVTNKKIVLYKNEDVSLVITLSEDGYTALQDSITFTDTISKKIVKVFGEIIPITENIESLFETEPFYFDKGEVEPSFVIEDIRVYGGAEMFFYPEQTVDIKWKIRRFTNDALFDPSSHEVSIYDPKNVKRVVYNSANLAKDAVGIYKYTFNLPADVVEGDWYARVKAVNGNWNSVLHIHLEVRKR